MSKLTEKFPFDYTPNGGTVHELGGCYVGEIKRIYGLLNDVRENNEGDNEPQPKQIMISENGKIYIRSLNNDKWVYMGDLKENFGLHELGFIKKDDINLEEGEDGETPLLGVNISGSASKFCAVPIKVEALKDGDVFVYDAANNLFVNKNVPVIDPKTGMINVSTTGNVGKLVNIPILTNAIADGEVLVYRPSLGGFVNESKSAVGSGKELVLMIDQSVFAGYSGSEVKNIKMVTTTSEEPMEDAVVSKALVWLKPV